MRSMDCGSRILLLGLWVPVGCLNLRGLNTIGPKYYGTRIVWGVHYGACITRLRAPDVVFALTGPKHGAGIRIPHGGA